MKFNNDIPIWYHGSPHKISSWSTEFVGQGDDQEGPGIYFTSSYEDAEGYSRKDSEDGFIYEVKLNFNKVLSPSSKPIIFELQKLIEWADDWEQTLQNIIGEETTKENWKEYKKMLLEEESMFTACQDVWYNFYKYDPQGYCSSMRALDYDGIILKKEFMGVYHAIVWNPNIIKFN